MYLCEIVYLGGEYLPSFAADSSIKYQSLQQTRTTAHPLHSGNYRINLDSETW